MLFGEVGKWLRRHRVSNSVAEFRASMRHIAGVGLALPVCISPPPIRHASAILHRLLVAVCAVHIRRLRPPLSKLCVTGRVSRSLLSCETPSSARRTLRPLCAPVVYMAVTTQVATWDVSR